MTCRNNHTRRNSMERQRGVSLYFAMMLTTLLLGIALGTSAMFFKQARLLRGIGDSVFSFFAADAGVERALMVDNTLCAADEDRIGCVISKTPLSAVELSNGAAYQVVVERGGTGSCDEGVNYCVKSVGTYQDARRAIKITR